MGNSLTREKEERCTFLTPSDLKKDSKILDRVLGDGSLLLHMFMWEGLPYACLSTQRVLHVQSMILEGIHDDLRCDTYLPACEWVNSSQHLRPAAQHRSCKAGLHNNRQQEIVQHLI